MFLESFNFFRGTPPKSSVRSRKANAITPIRKRAIPILSDRIPFPPFLPQQSSRQRLGLELKSQFCFMYLKSTIRHPFLFRYRIFNDCPPEVGPYFFNVFYHLFWAGKIRFSSPFIWSPPSFRNSHCGHLASQFWSFGKIAFSRLLNCAFLKAFSVLAKSATKGNEIRYKEPMVERCDQGSARALLFLFHVYFLYPKVFSDPQMLLPPPLSVLTLNMLPIHLS